MLVFMNTTWDIEGIRSQYPALKDGTVYLDGAGGTQVPECVIEAISDAYRSGLSNVKDGARILARILLIRVAG